MSLDEYRKRMQPYREAYRETLYALEHQWAAEISATVERVSKSLPIPVSEGWIRSLSGPEHELTIAHQQRVDALTMDYQITSEAIRRELGLDSG